MKEDKERATAAAAEVARSGDLYQSQRTPVTMATKLDFFFEVFSALLAGAHSPEKGGGSRGEGGLTEETAAAAAAAAAAQASRVRGGTDGVRRRRERRRETEREIEREYREGRGDSDERRPGKPIIRIENSQWPCI